MRLATRIKCSVITVTWLTSGCMIGVRIQTGSYPKGRSGSIFTVKTAQEIGRHLPPRLTLWILSPETWPSVRGSASRWSVGSAFHGTTIAGSPSRSALPWWYLSRPQPHPNYLPFIISSYSTLCCSHVCWSSIITYGIQESVQIAGSEFKIAFFQKFCFCFCKQI
jgi:hypothetical protein